MSRPQPKPLKGVPKRTIVTRATNAGKNPLDYEVPTSEEEDAPRAPTKRKKPTKKTREEAHAAEERRDAALADVGTLEEDMARQASINEGTPRPASISQRSSSHVVLDLPSARVKHSIIESSLTSTDDERAEFQPPMKKAKPFHDKPGDSRSKGKGREERTVSTLSILEQILTFTGQDSAKAKSGKPLKARPIRDSVKEIKAARASEIEQNDTITASNELLYPLQDILNLIKG